VLQRHLDYLNRAGLALYNKAANLHQQQQQ
jgi:hypothetical protein